MNKKGLCLVFGTAMISGVSIFVNKFGVSFSDPYVFTFLKNVMVALFLTSLILGGSGFLSLRRLKLKQWGLLFLIGIIGGGVAFLLFFKGLSMTTAAQGSFLQKTMFIYAALLASVFLKEKINRRFILGALFLVLGNLVILKTMNLSFGYGDFLILGAAILWAVENVISKYALRDLEGKIVAWGRMFFGSVLILIFLGLTGQAKEILAISSNQVGWTLVTSVLLFGYVMTWYSGLKLVSVSVATSVLLLGAPVTSFLSLLSVGKIGWQEAVASLLIIIGLGITLRAGIVFRQIKLLFRKYVRT